MLVRLSLRDFVIVDNAEIDFKAGFSALSGETGAGKSILLDALGLALGERADLGSIRAGAARAEITAEFEIDPAIDGWLAERELAGDPGLLLARRVIDADGRSRAFLNGHPTTATLLREVGQQLVDIHGQHATQRILSADGQRELLDRFAGLGTLTETLASRWDDWRMHREALERARNDQQGLALERERLEWKSAELKAVNAREGEWAELNVEQKRLAHAAALLAGAEQAHAQLTENDDSVQSQLGQLVHRIRPLAAIDAGLANVLDCLEAARIQVQEAASSCADYAAGVELDPQRLEAVETRLSALHSLARKLKLAPEQLPEVASETGQRLAQLDAAGDLAAMTAREQQSEAAYLKSAHQLSTARHKVAGEFARAVSQHLQGLGMKGSRFEIGIEAGPATRHGTDRLEFRLAGHAGTPPRPLGKVASGGELSRIGLAIAVQAAAANPVPTLIFDEADAGVGGAVAEVIGQLMRTLGETRQVFCVTHLPQVAAGAHQQLAVRKVSRRNHTTSEVIPLDEAARIEEIARMLGGVEITATTRRHARELLNKG